MAADNTIDYKFFEKEIASKYVMMKNSAMSGRVKMNGLTQEVIRRLRNTRESLDWEDVKAPIPTKFCKKVQRSGYSESYRTEVIKSGVVGYERQGCISCGILVSGIGARGVSSEHMENMEMFSLSPT